MPDTNNELHQLLSDIQRALIQQKELTGDMLFVDPVAPIPQQEITAIRRTGMGIVFQSFGLLPTLSALENVELPLRVLGVTVDEARERLSPSPRSSWPTSRSPRSTPRTPS